jgi:RNA polymerase sigma factor (TIGR02999 family)
LRREIALKTVITSKSFKKPGGKLAYNEATSDNRLGEITMIPAVPADVTRLLLAWSQGDQSALDQVVPLVYHELRKRAHQYMLGERSQHVLQTTALIHEAYQQLVQTPGIQWRDRAHFYAVCAQLMRRILVDYARSRGYQKRGANVREVSFDETAAAPRERSRDLVALDDALTALSAIDPRKGQVVELRFFGGLTAEETAEVLKVSPETVLRDWKLAKVWLLRELGGASNGTWPLAAYRASLSRGFGAKSLRSQ